MWLVNIDNLYLKICFDVLGDVSSRTSVAESACHELLRDTKVEDQKCSAFNEE